MPKRKLIEEHIEQNPNRPGLADAWLKDYGVPVWALIGYLEAVHGDIARTAADYDVPVDAVRAAIAFYRRYKSIIDDRRGVNVA
jgi:uncharacterized protein (DUF433 family)